MTKSPDIWLHNNKQTPLTVTTRERRGSLLKISMNCPHCQSTNTRKNGTSRSKQRWKCKDCNRTFTENPDPMRGGGRKPRKWKNDAERMRAYRAKHKSK